MTTTPPQPRGFRRSLALCVLGAVCAVGLLAGGTVLHFRLVERNEAALAAAGRLSEQVARLHEASARHFIGDEDWLRALPLLAEAIRLGTGDPARDRANRISFGMLVRRAPELSRIWMDGTRVLRLATDAEGQGLLVVRERVAEFLDLRRDTQPPLLWPTESAPWEGGTVSRDGQRALLQHDGGSFVLVDTTSGRLLFESPGLIRSEPEAFSSTGRSFISWAERTATLRDADTGKPDAAPLELAALVDWAVTTPWPNGALTKDKQGHLAVWHIDENGAASKPLAEVDGRNAHLAGFSVADKSILLRAEHDVFIFDAQTGALRKKVTARNLPQSFGQEADGKWLYLGRRSTGLEVRDLETSGLQFAAEHGALGFRGDFASHAPLLATQSWNGSARVWKIGRGDPVSPLLWQAATPGDCLLDPRGHWLATRGDEPAGRLWRLRGFDGAGAVDSISTDPVAAWFGGKPERLHVAEREGVVDAWSRTGATAAWAVRHPEPILAAGPCAGGRLIFTCGRTRAQLWDADTSAPASAEFKPAKPIVAASADPTAERLAIVLADGAVLVWSTAGEQTIAGKARRVEFSADGRKLLVIEDRAARVWDPASGAALSPAVDEPEGDARAHFSPDGTRVVQWSGATRSGRSVARIWDATTAVVQTRLAPHWRAINDVAFSPDGRLTASAGEDHMVIICDAKTGVATRPPCAHRQHVRRTGFSPDGAIVWAFDDDDLTLWDTSSAEQIGARLRHPGDPQAIVWSADSRLIATAGKKYRTRIWDCTPDTRSPEVLAAVARYLSAHTLIPGTSDLRGLTLDETRAAQKAAGVRN